MPEENNINKEATPQEEQKNEEQNGEEQEKDVQKEPGGINAMALLSYLGLLVLVPLLAAKGDSFAQFHAKQGLTLLITAVIAMFVGVVPIIGWILAPFITLACLVLAIIGIVNVLAKKKKELPLIGKYAKQLKF